MILKTKDNKEFNFIPMEVITCNQGEICVLDNGNCVKVYGESSSASMDIYSDQLRTISEEIIDYFRSLNNSHFCKIINAFYDGNSIAGFEMPFYNEIDNSILNVDSSYLVRNIKELSKLMYKLALDGVRVVDLNPNNLLLTENGIVIIDYDKYFFEKNSSIFERYKINRSALIYALSKRMENNLRELGNENISYSSLAKFVESIINLEEDKIVFPEFFSKRMN